MKFFNVACFHHLIEVILVDVYLISNQNKKTPMQCMLIFCISQPLNDRSAAETCAETSSWSKGLLRWRWWVGVLLLMAEIPNNHLGWCWKPINNGINYQPQLVNAGFQPSTVGGSLGWLVGSRVTWRQTWVQPSRAVHPKLGWVIWNGSCKQRIMFKCLLFVSDFEGQEMCRWSRNFQWHIMAYI